MAQVNNLHFPLHSEQASLPTVHETDLPRLFKGQQVIVLDGFVVDVQSFSREHPGGKSVLEAGYGGKDLSTGFRELNNHSRHALEIYKGLRIARVIKSSDTEKMDRKSD